MNTILKSKEIDIISTSLKKIARMEDVYVGRA